MEKSFWLPGSQTQVAHGVWETSRPTRLEGPGCLWDSLFCLHEWWSMRSGSIIPTPLEERLRQHTAGDLDTSFVSPAPPLYLAHGHTLNTTHPTTSDTTSEWLRRIGGAFQGLEIFLPNPRLQSTAEREASALSRVSRAIGQPAKVTQSSIIYRMVYSRISSGNQEIQCISLEEGPGICIPSLHHGSQGASPFPGSPCGCFGKVPVGWG